MVWHYLAEISNYISSDLLVSHAKPVHSQTLTFKTNNRPEGK